MSLREGLLEAARICAAEVAKYSQHGLESAACRGALHYAEDAIRARAAQEPNPEPQQDTHPDKSGGDNGVTVEPAVGEGLPDEPHTGSMNTLDALDAYVKHSRVLRVYAKAEHERAEKLQKNIAEKMCQLGSANKHADQLQEWNDTLRFQLREIKIQRQDDFRRADRLQDDLAALKKVVDEAQRFHRVRMWAAWDSGAMVEAANRLSDTLAAFDKRKGGKT